LRHANAFTSRHEARFPIASNHIACAPHSVNTFPHPPPYAACALRASCRASTSATSGSATLSLRRPSSKLDPLWLRLNHIKLASSSTRSGFASSTSSLLRLLQPPDRCALRRNVPSTSGTRPIFLSRRTALHSTKVSISEAVVRLFTVS
jgi:hypothetical protein